jgi:hypothetical protein
VQPLDLFDDATPLTYLLIRIFRACLNQRLAIAARAIADRGITPTVAGIRAALGGGSPNDLAPALKIWKASVASAASDVTADFGLPVQIADLAQERKRLDNPTLTP